MAGANKFEVLLFSLGKEEESGQEETFGINVFKVREVMVLPPLVKAPRRPGAVAGMVSLRGEMIPVIDLPGYCGFRRTRQPGVLIVTEYNQRVQGFIAESVETIVRLEWDAVHRPPDILEGQYGGLVNAVAEFGTDRVAMILDVEKVLADMAGVYDEEKLADDLPKVPEGTTVLFADDSAVARQQVERVLSAMGARSVVCSSGRELLERLAGLKEEAARKGRRLADCVPVVLTDIEMPEADGYVVTRSIKEDPACEGMVVLLHSSLSSEANRAIGEQVGADGYVAKFDAKALAEAVVEAVARRRGEQGRPRADQEARAAGARQG
ncbi:MAG: chemotaxis protein CheV [Gammaproteobacteria bacterium]|nr:MAG: chemotaxis protein CheV [Gammaproteobacteria bacterium]